MRAAVVGGVAYHAGKRVQQGREAEADQDYRLEQLEAQQQQQYAPPAAPAPQASGISAQAIEQLKQLGDLKDQGILTDEEFEVQKRRLLGTA
jgi:hypothetical protein